MIISNPKAADGYRQVYADASVSGNVVAATASTNAITALSAKHTVFVQKLTVVITTSAAQIITIADSNGTAVVIGSIAASAALGSIYTIDFGSRGFGLTEGKNLVLSQTAGPAYSYTVEAYQKQTTAGQSTTTDRTI
jgi:hypothetical protein